MSQNQPVQEESSLQYFLRLVFSNWKFLFITNLIVGITTVITLLIIPKWYKSEATIVILEENNSPLNNLLSDFSALGLGMGGSVGVDTYIQYLNTKKMYDRLIDQFNLMEEYEAEFPEDAYDIIYNNLGIADNENNTFTISFAFKEDSKKAKEIVEFVFQELDRIALEVDQAQASNFREYIEGYYLETKNELIKNEELLASFQKKTGIFDLPVQVEATLKGIADLELQKTQFEIEREFIKKTFQNSSKIQEIDNQIKSITDKISELKNIQGVAFVALDSAPDKGTDYLRIQRDIKIGSEVSAFLRLQYEQALLDEQKINSNLYMVDPPKIAQKKFKPQRSKILLVVMFFTVIISLVFIRIKEYGKENEEALKNLVNNA